MRYLLMSKATLNLASPVTLSKLDTTDWSRELWRAAYWQPRARVGDRRTSTAATAYVWPEFAVGGERAGITAQTQALARRPRSACAYRLLGAGRLSRRRGWSWAPGRRAS